jgi:hypothetical protein
MEDEELGEFLVMAEGRAAYGAPVRSHRDLRVYQRSFGLALRVYELTKQLPTDERFVVGGPGSPIFAFGGGEPG